MDSFVLYDYGNSLEDSAMPQQPDEIATKIVKVPRATGSADDTGTLRAEQILDLLDRRHEEDVTHTATLEDSRPSKPKKRRRAARRKFTRKGSHSGSSAGLAAAVMVALASAVALTLVFFQG